MTGSVRAPLDALSVARAALMEVDGNPDDVVPMPDPTNPGRVALTVGTWEAARAVHLGYMAEYGPEFMTRCERCAFAADARKTRPCTPVRDVLRGVTCGR